MKKKEGKFRNFRTQCVKEQEGHVAQDMEDLFNEEETHKIRASLLQWYDKHQRDLPWRRRIREEDATGVEDTGEEKKRRAYGVWVSEMMLQQTRVQTVVDYYNRWMDKWPTLQHLAQASLEEVNEMWAGLGYYRRARFLLEGAKMIVAEGGVFPNTLFALRKVPGIGDYTAGAIASIAFGEGVPAVDGNVIRVLARLKAISTNPRDKNTIKSFWKLAAQLVDPSSPGDFNQSLMELGATLCTPLNPRCSSCPISGQCRALSFSTLDETIKVTDFPKKLAKAKRRIDFSAVCVMEICGSENIDEENRSFLLIKRPVEGLLAGLWEFPSVTLNKEADLSTRRKIIDHFLRNSFSLVLSENGYIISREYVGEFVHIFSHIRRKIYVESLVLHLKGGLHGLIRKQEKEAMTWKLVNSEALASMGLTSAVRKVYVMFQKFRQNVVPTEIQMPRGVRSKKLRSS